MTPIVWKAIEDYEGLYEVSSDGRVRSLDRVLVVRPVNNLEFKKNISGKLLNLSKDGNGYYHVRLYKNNVVKSVMTHRIVAKAFILNPDNKPQINHKDGNKENNNVDNLEWCTGLENIRHAFATGLKVKPPSGVDSPNYKGVIVVLKDGLVIDELTGERDMVAKGYHSGNISGVMSGRRKTHRGCTFVYKEDLIENNS